MAAFVIAGVLAATRLNRGLFPEFEVPLVQISVAYPGASAEEVERSVCLRVEDQLRNVSGVKRVESLASESFALTTVTLTDDVDPSEARADIEAQIDRIDNFPDLAERPVVELIDIQLSVLSIAIAGNVAEKDLLAYAQQLRDELLRLEDVTDVTLSGFSDHEIQIKVDESALVAHGLSLRDVSSAIRAHSVDLPGGEIDVGDREISVRVADQRRWTDQFRDLTVVSNSNGAMIPLRAIAELQDSFDEPWIFATYNGKPACQLSVGTQSREDVLAVASRVKRHLDDSRTVYPDEISLAIWKDNSPILNGRWTMVVENLALGVLLVFLTLWLFLNGRLALWVALGIPISFLGTLAVLDAKGMPIDMISMLGLIVAIGLIVDDAIVIAENVYAHRQRGASGIDAAINGTREVSIGVLSSFITTVAIFFPLLMIAGTYGKILYVVPFCVILALGVSLIEAFLILPKHLSTALPDRSQPHPLRKRIDRMINSVRDNVYGSLLDWSLRNRATTFAVMFAVLIAAAGLVLGGRLAFRPMPDMDTNWISATIVMPEGTSSDRTREVARRVEASLRQVDEHFSPNEVGQRDLVRHVCGYYGSLPEVTEQGPHVASIWLEMIDTEFRVANINDVARYWKEQVGDVADVERLTFEQVMVGPQLRPIHLALHGCDLESLQRAGEKAQDKLREFAGVKNIRSDYSSGRQEIRVRLKESAQTLGFTSSDVANQLRAGFFGEHVQQFQRGDDVVDVTVMLSDKDRSSLEDVTLFQLLSPTGTSVALHEVADTEIGHGLSTLSRLNGRQVVNVFADVNPAKANAALILSGLRRHYFPTLQSEFPGLTVQLRGETEETAESIGSLIRNSIIGVVAIFLVLSFTFRSYLEPLIILLAIPPGVVGVIVGHWLLGINISMLSMIGLVSLAGILVNDSIVMVEFIKLRLSEGMIPIEAFSQAGRDRFRAVVLTTATTCMGLMPMLLETSMQATVFKGLVVAIVFGELFSTTMILILIPCSYSVLGQAGLLATNDVNADAVSVTG
ncbi:efflux RND transporter permease subunit [Stieleria sp.]